MKELKNDFSYPSSILIVEDNPEQSLTLSHIIQKQLGITVDKAKNALDALKLMDTKRFDIIITDINMPDMSGIDLINEAQRRNHNAFFIIISGSEKPQHLLESIRLGVIDFIVKPFDFKEVHETINRVLEICVSKNKIRSIIAATEPELLERIAKEERKITLLRLFNNEKRSHHS